MIAGLTKRRVGTSLKRAAISVKPLRLMTSRCIFVINSQSANVDATLSQSRSRADRTPPDLGETVVRKSIWIPIGRRELVENAFSFPPPGRFNLGISLSRNLSALSSSVETKTVTGSLGWLDQSDCSVTFNSPRKQLNSESLTCGICALVRSGSASEICTIFVLLYYNETAHVL